MNANSLPAVMDPVDQNLGLPPAVARAGAGARFAWEELFAGQLRNPNTKRAYSYSVRRFLVWCDAHRLELGQVTPAWVGTYYDALPMSITTKKQHLSALRCFFDRLVLRHAVCLNPAASVRGERFHIAQGTTPGITVEQERLLLKSIRTDGLVGLRDRAIVAVLIYTAARIGAVAGLRANSFACTNGDSTLRFLEKGGKLREIPVRIDLGQYLSAYLEAAGLLHQPTESPMFRRLTRKAGLLRPEAMTADDIRRMVKKRMSAIGLPDELSPHSFRVGTISDLLTQGVSIEDVAQLAGHADIRTTRLYDRRQKKILRWIVDCISV